MKVENLNQGSYKMLPDCSRNGANMVPKFSQHGPTSINKQCKKQGPETARKWVVAVNRIGVHFQAASDRNQKPR